MKVIDLFCGAGGFSLAIKNLGFEVLGALEMDARSCETYRNNILKKNQKERLIEGDITKISPEDFMRRLKIKKGDCDLVVGGPPCQGFSSLQLQSKKNDPRNELLINYFNFVKAISPKAFLVENVPGMLWSKHREYVERFYQLADKSGYYVYKPEVLDAKDYGVPQTRKRVFIYGIRKDLNPVIRSHWAPKRTHTDPTSLDVKMGLLAPWKPSKEVFEKELSKEDPNNVHMHHSQELIEVFKSTPRNGGSRAESKRILPCHKNHSGHKDVYGRIDMRKPGPTMTTSCTNPSKGRFVHPTKNNGITVRHAARFQTFPDDFIFSGGIIAASKQIGNAVPVELGKIVIKHITNDLKLLKISNAPKGKKINRIKIAA